MLRDDHVVRTGGVELGEVPDLEVDEVIQARAPGLRGCHRYHLRRDVESIEALEHAEFSPTKLPVPGATSERQGSETTTATKVRRRDPGRKVHALVTGDQLVPPATDSRNRPPLSGFPVDIGPLPDDPILGATPELL